MRVNQTLTALVVLWHVTLSAAQHPVLRPKPPLASEQAGRADAAFTTFADRFFDGFFHFNPARATQAGLHEYDGELPAYSRRDFEAEIARSRRALRELEGIPRHALLRENQFDARLLESSIRAHLLDLESLRLWEKDPDFYNGLASGALFVLVKREFAPVDDRLKSLIARERQVPAILENARANVVNPPAVYTNIAIRQVGSEIDFLKNQLPEAVASAHDDASKAEFSRVNQQALEAYQKFLDYLKTDLAPRSRGGFAIGAENYREKLLYDEMVDTPAERLLSLGQRELRRTQTDLKATAALISPSKSPAEVLKEVAEDHPDSDHLIPETQETLSELRQFLGARAIVTILSPENPRVVETPPFMRALTFASMDTPGPFEENSAAFYNVTLPERDWSDTRKNEYLGAFNRYAIRVTSIHEALPGHYTQFLWLKRQPTKVRKLVGSLHQPWGEIGSNGEGWAHYAEQMMLEQGYGEGDPKLLLFQLQAALVRLCRYIVGIRMHTRGMTLEQGTEFFKKEGYMEQVSAEREAMRGTADPTYLVYTLGKLQILKLREDYRKKLGDRFNLMDFHDRFLSFGNVPVKMIREEMLGDDSPTL